MKCVVKKYNKTQTISSISAIEKNEGGGEEMMNIF